MVRIKVFTRRSIESFSLFSLVEVVINLFRFHSHLQTFSIATQFAVCPILSAYFTLAMSKNAPDLFRLAPPEESPAGVARHSTIVEMGGCRTSTHTAHGCQAVVLLSNTFRRHGSFSCVYL